MASRAIIARLASRIEALAERLVPQLPHRVVCITVGVGESEEEVLERHLAEHPEDREVLSRPTQWPNLIVRQMVAPSPEQKAEAERRERMVARWRAEQL